VTTGEAPAVACAAESRVAGSTAQDTARGKHTEMDALNGYITRRGRELGVPTPLNHTLFALVKLLEENRKDA